MTDNIQNAVDAVFDNNGSAFQDSIRAALNDRLRERVGVEKISIAQSMFNEPEEIDEPDVDGEDSNEEI